MKPLKTHCSDWQKSWGLGTNHIGKLFLDELNNQFIWKGHQQGRHGQVWNKGQEIHFIVTLEGQIKITYRKHEHDSLPDMAEVMGAVNRLWEMQTK